MRTSFAAGQPARSPSATATGSIRHAGRYLVFPRAALAEIAHATASATASSRSGTACRSSHRVWTRGPEIIVLHHVHAQMWGMVLPPALAKLGNSSSARVAPSLYRGEPRGHAVGVVEDGDRRGPGLPGRPRRRRATRRAPPLLPCPRAAAPRPLRTSSRSVGWCPSSASTTSSGPAPRPAASSPTSRSPSWAAATSTTSSTPWCAAWATATGCTSCRASATTSSSAPTARPDSSPAPRHARVGA